MIEFGFFKEVHLPFEAVVKNLPGALKRKGFEVLSTIRLDSELHRHLGVDYSSYTILSVSNLQLAYRALMKEMHYGLLQTFNIAIYQKDASTVVGTLRPSQFTASLDDEFLHQGGALIEKKLLEVLEELEKKKFTKNKPEPPQKCQRAVA